MIISTGPESIQKCTTALAEGRLVGMPTETVYGLAADACQDEAVAGIFAAKNRPQFNPLIIHGHSIEMIQDYAEFSSQALKLASRFWPGPLTLVLPRKGNCPLSLLVSAGLDTVAVRIPQHPVAQALLQAYGKPLAAPSANPSGLLSPTCAKDVEAALGDEVAYVIDGGRCHVGVESTIVDMTSDQPVLLRPGGIATEELESHVGHISSHKGTEIKSPGMMQSHYAPRLPVRINVNELKPGEAFLGFGPNMDHADLNLSPSGDLKEAAANLFKMLRQLDTTPHQAIAVASIPEQGLGVAINDRLKRASVR